MMVSADPVGAGLVSSLARPGGNVTGMSILAPPVGGKRLGLLREAIPTIAAVAVLWNAADPAKGLEWKDTQTAAKALGVRLQSVEVRGPADFDTAFRTIAQARPDALIVFSEPLTLRYQRSIVDFSAKNRLPLISEIGEFAHAGGLMAYGASLADLFLRSAAYVDKILKGAKPADLPVEQPTKFELVINLKTAKALGLTIPSSLLLRADQVIE
jgi:putative ABC transport system substrate-binding protein